MKLGRLIGEARGVLGDLSRGSSRAQEFETQAEAERLIRKELLRFIRDYRSDQAHLVRMVMRLQTLIEAARQVVGRAKTEILLSTPWIEVRDYIEPPHGQYTFVHEPKTHGRRVAVLPFRDNDDGSRAYLMRSEGVVPWMDEPQMRGVLIPCALTGGMEDPTELPVDAALREIAEETGFVLPPDRLVDLGHCRATKCMSTRYYLFGADVTGLLPKLATTDGTGGENGCRVLWTRTPQQYLDPIAGMMWARLQAR